MNVLNSIIVLRESNPPTRMCKLLTCSSQTFAFGFVYAPTCRMAGRFMPSFKQRPSFTGLPGSGTLLFGLCLNYLVIQKDFSNKYKSQMFVKQMISV